jgi:hypothetical protein
MVGRAFDDNVQSPDNYAQTGFVMSPQNKSLQGESLKAFLIDQPRSDIAKVFSSGFLRGLADCRLATNRDADGNKISGKTHDSWVGAIGYFALLNQLGNAIKPKGQTATSTTGIEKALEFFSAASSDDRAALYALRNAFAHDFSLRACAGRS